MLSERLADFALGLDAEAIPPAVRDRARWHLLDALGVCLASSSMAFGPAALVAAERLGQGDESTVVGFGRRLPAASAALANGALLHGLEYDDTHTPSIIHGSSVVVPAALAAAEAARASGRELLAALVIGWEALIRLGLAAPGAFQRRGFQTTAVCGPFAAALVAGRLLGLNREQLVGALGIAGSQAAGIFEYLADGASVKQLHPGLAAHSGLVAVHLAAGGFRGPRSVFEGRFGLYRAFAGEGEYDLERVAADLGQVWHTLSMSFKPYPCCHFNHAFIDCARAIRERGVEAHAIEQVTCLGPSEIMPIVCEPWPRKLRPASGYDARFSLPYAVAAAFVHGRVGHGTFTDAAVQDAAVLGLADRTQYVVDPESGFPETFPGWIRVRTRDGRVWEQRQAANRGGPKNPMSGDEIREKFMDNARLRLSPEAAGRLADAILQIERYERVDRLWETVGATR